MAKISVPLHLGDFDCEPLQLGRWGSDGVCERDKQTEHPGSASQTAPSVAVTWGWGSHDLLS